MRLIKSSFSKTISTCKSHVLVNFVSHCKTHLLLGNIPSLSKTHISQQQLGNIPTLSNFADLHP